MTYFLRKSVFQQRCQNTLHGFSLVELLVVGAILAILATVGTISYLDILREQQRKEAQVELENIKFALELHLREYGSLPPGVPTGSDLCTLCTYHYGGTSYDAPSEWNTVADDLENEGWFREAPRQDPWGQYYGYDNNHWPGDSCQGGNCHTPICSIGPDGKFTTIDDLGFGSIGEWLETDPQPETTGDDICVFILKK